MCVITTYFCPRCHSNVASCDNPCDQTPCQFIFHGPKRVHEKCSYCLQIEKEIEDTKAMIEDIRKYLENAEMDDLANRVAGLSTGSKNQLEWQLEDLETKMRHLEMRWAWKGGRRETWWLTNERIQALNNATAKNRQKLGVKGADPELLGRPVYLPSPAVASGSLVVMQNTSLPDDEPVEVGANIMDPDELLALSWKYVHDMLKSKPVTWLEEEAVMQRP